MIALTLLAFGYVNMNNVAFADKKAKAQRTKTKNTKKGPKKQGKVWIKDKDGNWTEHDCKSPYPPYRKLDDDACIKLCNSQFDHKCWKTSTGRIMKPANQAGSMKDKTKSK